MSERSKKCLYCELSSDAIPLISLEYRGKQLEICPQHLPFLIHNPAKLAGKLPGAEDMASADHED